MTRVRTLMTAAFWLVVSLVARGAQAKSPSALLPLPDVSSANCPTPPGFNAPVCFAVTATNTSGESYAIYGESNISTGTGVNGHSDHGTATQGVTTNGTGVRGYAYTSGTGVIGYSTTGTGVHGEAPSSGVNGVEGFSGSSVASGVYGYNSSGSGYGVAGRTTGTGKAVYGDCATQGGWAGYFNGNLYATYAFKPGGGSWGDTSDVRLKKDVRPLEGALERLLKLKGVTFEWIEPEKHGNFRGRQTGLIAQEVEKVFPEWVGSDPEGFKTVTVRGLEALSVEAMRTLRNDNDALRAQVSKLEDRIKKVENSRPTVVAGFGAGSLAGVGAIAAALGLVLASRRRAA